MTATDLVVVLPGIMGSSLGVRGSDGAPASENLVWAPTAGAVWKFLTGGDTILKHALPDGIGDADPDDGVEPVALMPDVHVIPGVWTPIKGYDVTVSELEKLGYQRSAQGRPGNLLPLPYDWRLSNRRNGERVKAVVEPALEQWRAQGGEFADARVVFVCHSMGGLVARWYVEMCGGHEVTRKLITLGTPWRGATNALEQLVNGVRKGFGPLAVDLTGFARSLPSLHQLLPEYACISSPNGYLKTTEAQLPGLSTAMVADAMAFHTDLQAAERARPESRGMAHMVVGVRQPTNTTVTLDGDHAATSQLFGDTNDYGDGTVTLTGAVGHDEPLDTNLVVRVPDQHTNLQCNRFVLDQVQEVLTAEPVRRRELKNVRLGVAVPDVVLAGEEVEVGIELEREADDGGPTSHALRVIVTTERGRVLSSTQPRVREGRATARFDDLPPGTHTVTVDGPTASSPVRPVTSTVLVWPRER